MMNKFNDEMQQYKKFETMFMSERRKEVKEKLINLPKSQVVSILDSYDEMIHEIHPDVIGVVDCINLAIERGLISKDTCNISNLYRELSATAIDVVEGELYDILKDPEDEDLDNDTSKICGENYYNLEDALTDLFVKSQL